MSEEPIDVSDMIAVHDGMRKEYASLPLRVKSSDDADVDRAAAVADHIALLGAWMQAHHDGEDELLWPLVRERAPEHEAIFVMEAEHSELNDYVARIGAQAEAWRDDPSPSNRATLHTTLIEFEKRLLTHLGHEERELLPLLARTVSEEEYAAFGTYMRQHLTPEQGVLIIGLILDDTSTAQGERFLDGMGPEARARFEQEGRPVYREYRTRFLSA